MDSADSNLHEIFFITDHLFNSDNSFEFLYSVFGGSGSNAVLLCDDNGVILQTFANKYYAQLKKNNLGIYKLIINDGNSNFMGPPVHNIDVYSLSGTLSTNQEQIYAKNISFAYPNPANEIINISNKSSNNENVERTCIN
jgi:hypothetical protein